MGQSDSSSVINTHKQKNRKGKTMAHHHSLLLARENKDAELVKHKKSEVCHP